MPYNSARIIVSGKAHNDFASLNFFRSRHFIQIRIWINMNTETLGFGPSFSSFTPPDGIPEWRPARITTAHKDSYTIHTGSQEISAELTGKFMFTAESPLDYPCVGDWVAAQMLDEGTFAVIHSLFPRRSLLKRKTSGKQVEYQLIAANIDEAMIMQSLDADFSMNRLDRYLVMVREGRIEPSVLLSKSDLLKPDEVISMRERILEIYPTLPVIAFSNESADGLESIKKRLEPGRTFCLLGSSGVGKTTLLNLLIGEQKYETAAIREKDSKGRHTTTTRHLIILPGGGMIIDTPGMRELGTTDAEAGLDHVFKDIESLAAGCRFADCTHTHEQGCAVTEAVETGALTGKRYENYMKMKRESAHYARSYHEKRQRDKEFGKMVKSIMKTHKKRQ